MRLGSEVSDFVVGPLVRLSGIMIFTRITSICLISSLFGKIV